MTEDSSAANTTASRDEPNESLKKRNDKGKSQPSKNESLPVCQSWRFGSFTFLNLISSAAIVLGIGTAVLFARVYYDHRIGSQAPDAIRPASTPVDVPVTIDGWEPDIASRPVNLEAGREKVEPRATAAPASRATDAQTRPTDKEATAGEQQTDASVSSTPKAENKDDRTRIVDGHLKRAEEGAKNATDDEKLDEKAIHVEPSVLIEKLDDFVKAELPADKVHDDTSPEKLANASKPSTIKDAAEPRQTSDDLTGGDREAHRVSPPGSSTGQVQQQRREYTVEAVIQRAVNISDIEDMYQWVLDDAEVVGLEKVLSALETSKYGGKMELAKACLLDRLSIIRETDSNVHRALTALTALVQHANSTIEEKTFAYRKMAEKRLRQGDYRQAIAHMKNLAELNPEDIEVWIELSTYNLYAGEVDEAKKNLEMVLEKEPDNGLATLNLGSLLMISASQGEPIKMPIGKVADMLAYGLNNTEPHVHETRHYAQLYDALIRSDRELEAFQYTKQGVEEDVLAGEYQLCQSFLSAHATKPLWTPAEVTYNFTEISQLVKNLTETYGERIESLPTHPENPFFVRSGQIEIIELLLEGERLSNCDSSEEAGALCAIAEKVVGNCNFCDSYAMRMSEDASYWKHSGVNNLGLRTIWVLRRSGNNTTLGVDVGIESGTLDKEGFVIFDHSYVHGLHAHSAGRTSNYWLLVAESWHPNVDNDTKESLRKKRG